jgi:hypothetical protein
MSLGSAIGPVTTHASRNRSSVAMAVLEEGRRTQPSKVLRSVLRDGASMALASVAIGLNGDIGGRARWNVNENTMVNPRRSGAA